MSLSFDLPLLHKSYVRMWSPTQNVFNQKTKTFQEKHYIICIHFFNPSKTHVLKEWTLLQKVFKHARNWSWDVSMATVYKTMRVGMQTALQTHVSGAAPRCGCILGNEFGWEIPTKYSTVGCQWNDEKGEAIGRQEQLSGCCRGFQRSELNSAHLQTLFRSFHKIKIKNSSISCFVTL